MAGIAAAVAVALRALTGVWLAVVLAAVAVAAHTMPYVLFSSRQLLAPAFSFSLALWGPLVAGGLFQYLTIWRRFVAADATSRRFRDHLELVAHEMRSPLTAIQGSSEVMSRYPLDQGRRQQLAELIHRESRRLATLVERFLDVERLSAGEMELRRQPVALRHLVERTMERVQPLAERKKSNCEWQLAGSQRQWAIPSCWNSRCITCSATPSSIHRKAVRSRCRFIAMQHWG